MSNSSCNCSSSGKLALHGKAAVNKAEKLAYHLLQFARDIPFVYAYVIGALGQVEYCHNLSKNCRCSKPGKKEFFVRDRINLIDYTNLQTRWSAHKRNTRQVNADGKQKHGRVCLSPSCHQLCHQQDPTPRNPTYFTCCTAVGRYVCETGARHNADTEEVFRRCCPNGEVVRVSALICFGNLLPQTVWKLSKLRLQQAQCARAAGLLSF